MAGRGWEGEGKGKGEEEKEERGEGKGTESEENGKAPPYHDWGNSAFVVWG